MQILIPDSWLREYLTTDATPKDIQRCLSLCGPSIERMHENAGDYVYDIEVTTNRVNCMSVLGIAREALAILPRFGFSAKLVSDPFAKKLSLTPKSSVDYLTANVNSILCPKFSAALITNVKVGPSPDWLVKKLELVGLRSLNNVIDISNYLTHELGQPVHTFDYAKIGKQSMKLRESRPGEQLTTLDKKTHDLPGGDIVIEDGTGNLIDLSGIMGALNSSVDENTTSVLLFVQTYEPVHIRKTSMALGQRTTAAVLFEKGLPTESVIPTLHQGLKLLKELAGGTVHSEILDISAEEPEDQIINLATPLTKYATDRLGIELTSKEVKTILADLGFKMLSETKIAIPWFRRLDIQIPEDLVEEVARIYGYHNIPSTLMAGPLPTLRDDSQFYWISKIKAALKYWGFTESYTYSLTPSDTGLKLKNPLSSEWTYLRTSLVPSHLQIIEENLGRVPELNFFEIANVYKPRTNNLPEEDIHLVISTSNKDQAKLKGIVTALFNGEMGITVGFNEEVQEHSDCLTYEINLSAEIPRAKNTKTYQPISKFAPIIEDINVELTKPYPELVKQLRHLSPLIQNIDLVDQYNTKITLRITFHSSEKQLASEDIAPLREKLAKLVV